MALNRVLLTGRLVSDPETRETGAGIKAANVRIAVERDFKNRETGARDADFFTIVAWRGTADFLERYFHKGELVTVDGRLRQSNYVDRDGNNRSTVNVVAESLYFGGGKRKDDQNPGGGQQNGGPFYPIPESRSEDDLPW